MKKWLCMSVGLLLVSMAIQAKTLKEEDIPPVLQPWVDWVLWDQDHYKCPRDYEQSQRAQCAWPGELVINLTGSGGHFEQVWQVFQPSWVGLPGRVETWPQSVKVNNKSTPVVERDGKPAVFLTIGEHTMTGRFAWEGLPEQLPIPKTTGWLTVSVNGTLVSQPNIDKTGHLWLHKSDAGDSATDQLNIKVFRKISDTIPLQMQVTIELQVSGRSREVTLGKLFSDHFTPLTLSSQLPVRIDEQGHLRAQVRTGKWQVVATAFQPQPVVDIKRHQPEGEWPETEIWGFQAHNALRLLRITGMTQLNAQELALPSDMKRLPVYLANVGEVLTLTASQRGDTGRTKDNYSINRQWYLDFDGGGYTVRDKITGEAHRERRIEMSSPSVLGQVVLNGQPRFITQLDEKNTEGVEVRKGKVSLLADSRYEQQRSPLPAVGWDLNVQSLRGSIHLPPGWRVLAVSGVDTAPETWLQRWSLLDIFLVLLVAVAAGKLWRWYWGVLALLAMVLIYHEADAPRWIWLYAIAAVAIFQAMPEGRGKKWAKRLKNGVLLVLGLMVLNFAINQARTGLHPQLEHYHTAMSSGYSNQTYAEKEDYSHYSPAPSLSIRSNNVSGKVMKQRVKKKSFFDPNAKIQTGPGVPQWRWNSISLGWDGPVQADQEIQVYYVPPVVNQGLNFVRIGLVMLLLLVVLGILPRKKPELKKSASAPQAPLLVLALCLCWPLLSDAEVPTPELLQQLKQRLVATPDCDSCASISQLRLTVKQEQITIQLQAHSIGMTMVPLPSIQKWQAESIWRDKQVIQAVRQDKKGVRWITLEPGVQQITLKGVLPKKERVQIAFPMPAKTLHANVTGWSLKGLSKQPQSQIEIVRVQNTVEQKVYQSSQLPAFVEVERTLVFGVDWEVVTKVTRLSALDQPVVMEIPLLPGESVTTSQVLVKLGRVQVSLPAGKRHMQWRSVLAKQELVVLDAQQKKPWVEVWKVELSPLWHAVFSDLPRINRAGSALVWQPWPGESLHIILSKPKGVTGETMTVDKATLSVKPGVRTTSTTADIAMRSSRGGQQSVVLPEGAVLQSLKLNGREQAMLQTTGQIDIPVQPGEQNLSLTWLDQQGMQLQYQTPLFKVGAQGVNSVLEVRVPQDRWILWVSGPSFGPAVLFWGEMIVLILISIGLGRVKHLPLKTGHWMLLWVGLAMASLEASIMVIAWFFIMRARQQHYMTMRWWQFNLMQIVLVGITIAAMASLVLCVEQGLLGSPDMSVAGNGSSDHYLSWYQDRFQSALPTATVISLPLMVYRLLMLLWALWLAYALIRWLRWGWGCYTEGSLWQPKPKKQKVPTVRGAKRLTANDVKVD
ncbi:MAG: hypothetical protein HN790_00585 [Methylococcales bacterium]|jgi:hypothetical protein|nr:hypothetical protein [Methylococcales bacterium]